MVSRWSFAFTRKSIEDVLIRLQFWSQRDPTISAEKLYHRFFKNTILNTPLLISSTTAPVAPETLKILSVLSVTTLKRSSVRQEAMNLFWKSVRRQTSQGALQVYH